MAKRRATPVACVLAFMAKGIESMANKTPLEVELSSELIEQYKEALAGLSDMRLAILLLFNSFEEIMKSFAAWRLGCHIDELPEFLTSTPRYLFEVTLVGPSAKDLLNQTKAFRELRNTVAHRFHRDDYERKLEKFVETILKHPCPGSEDAKRKDLLEAVSTIALEIADYIDDLQPRGEWPFPFLTLELNALEPGTKLSSG